MVEVSRKGGRGETPLSAAMELEPGNHVPSGGEAPGVIMPPCVGAAAAWLLSTFEDEGSIEYPRNSCVSLAQRARTVSTRGERYKAV